MSLDATPADTLIERFNLESQTPEAERIDGLRSVVPEAFGDGRIDVDALRRSLGDWVDPGSERFGLTWPGKADCMRVIREPSIGTLVPMPEESVDWDATQNVVIEGENLEVLKLLQKAYYGKVKLIYIDPPYNTGKEFIYPDNFREGLADYLRYSGQVDGDGILQSANSDTNGRYHSRWLSMMFPRLFLARNLLRDDGVIFASIDDHEVHNLRAVMNEIFGEESFIACCVWQKRYSRENRGSIGDAHEYLLVYGRDSAMFQESRGLIAPTDKQTAVYRNPNNDPKGRWRPVPMTAQGYRARQMYEVVTPAGTTHLPPEGRCWSMVESEYLRLRGEGRIYFGKDGSSQPNVIRYLSEMEGLVPWTWWPSDEVGHTDEARKEVQQIFGTQTAFDTPKPTRLMKRVLEIACGPSDLVLDFFSGSGTLGQAVLEENALDGGARRFILVQLPEKTEASSTESIADVTRGRIRWAGQRIEAAPQRLGAGETDTGFRAMRLSTSNFSVWNSESSGADGEAQLSLAAEHLAPESTEASMLAELLLKAGFELTVPVDRLNVAGVPVHSVAGGELLVCLGRELSVELFEQMVALGPSLIVVLDAGFGSDELKVNALQTVRAHNRATGSDMSLRVV